MTAGDGASLTGKRTIESVKGAERVLEALKTLAEEAERVAEFEAAHAKWLARQPQGQLAGDGAAGGAAEAVGKEPLLVPNMLLLGLDDGAYLLKALSSVRATELEQALLLLPFDATTSLLRRLLPLVPSAAPIELMAKCILFLIRVHHKQIVASRALLPLVHELDATLKARLAKEQHVVGYNLAAMRFMRHNLEQSADTKFFARALEQGTKGESVAELRRKTAARARGTKKDKGPKRKRPAEEAKP